MGRHTNQEERPLPVPAKVGLLGAVAVVALGAAVLVAPPDALARLPWASDRSCPPQTVELVVEPEVRDVVTETLAPLRGTALPDGSCLQASVTAQEASETVAASEILPPDRAPQVWIPDSDVWVAKVTRW